MRDLPIAALGLFPSANEWVDVMTMLLARDHAVARGRRLTGGDNGVCRRMRGVTVLGAVLTMTLIAGSGFAATNIGDTAQGRANVADERAALIAKLQRLQRERAAINEGRPADAIGAAIQQEQDHIRPITGACR